RYKVHLQVIDDTGSITFVMFDRVVFQVVGLTAQDLLDSMNNDASSHPYPPQLDMFVNKWMLFKVEVSDANLYRNWRGYNVKKVTSDENVINQFTAIHGITLNGDANDTDFEYPECDLGDDIPSLVVDGVESSNKPDAMVSKSGQTPTSKLSDKKEADIGVTNVSAAGKSKAKRIIDLGDDDDVVLSDTLDLFANKSTGNVKRIIHLGGDGVAFSNELNPSTSKSNVATTTQLAENPLVTTKETKLACVKIEGSK
ncbi:hypothetical protein L195_g014540, partial [Trifolium pratense]